MKTVYLAGLISTDFPESLQWRNDVAPTLAQCMRVLSPMRGKQDFKLEHGGLTDPQLTSKDIITRDFHDVEQSDVILVHLEDFGSPRPLVGTVCELAWAWLLRKPVVAIAKEENKLMRLHPFIREAVSHYCTTMEEAIAFVLHYYS